MKRYPCSWIRRPTIVMELTKQIYRFNTSPTKTPADPVAEIDKLVLRYIWKCQGPRAVRITLSFHEALPLPDTKPGTAQLQWWRQSAPGATADKRPDATDKGVQKGTPDGRRRGQAAGLSEQSTFSKGHWINRRLYRETKLGSLLASDRNKKSN